MKIILIIPCLILGLGCSSSPTDKHTNNKEAGSGQELIVNDSSLYDPTFLNGLKNYSGSIQLVGSSIIVDGDTMSFPVEIPIGGVEVFEGLSKTRKFNLTVSGVNITTIGYRFVISDLDGKVIEEREGNAVLTPMFFLGSEVDEDPEANEGYMASEYWQMNDLAIRIGERDEQNRLRAKVKHRSLRLDECPTLKTR